MKNKIDQFSLDSMGKNPLNWRGPLYFNRKDPRIIVPKINPLMGWTLNFANVLTYIIIAGFILIIVASKYLL
jgi:uncharacterized membrane protein